jgi:hypothetical protein
MTQLLIRALEAAHAGPSEQKILQERIVGRDLAAFERTTGQRYMITGEDGKKHPARELLLSEAIESSTLIQTEIKRTVIEGAEPAKCMRNAVPIMPMAGNTMQINIGESGSYSPVVSEGAEIPMNNQVYTARTWTAKKLGERPVITKEMIRDSLFGVIELETRKAGLRIENSLNQWMLSTLLENAGNEFDIAAVASGGTAGVKAIIAARALNLVDGYTSDTIIAHPAVSQYLYKDFVPGYTVQAQDYVNNATLPKVMGCSVYECGVDVTTTSSPFKVSTATYDWSGPTDEKAGYLVFDSKNAGYIGMRQDIEIEEMRDPIRDLVNFCMTMRVACQYGVANAACRVKFHGA